MQLPRPKSVETILAEYGHPREHHFTCARIVHFLTKTPIPKLQLHPTLWNFYNSQKPIDRGIAIFFQSSIFLQQPTKQTHLSKDQRNA